MKRAPHRGVQSRFCVIYIYYKSGSHYRASELISLYFLVFKTKLERDGVTEQQQTYQLLKVITFSTEYTTSP